MKCPGYRLCSYDKKILGMHALGILLTLFLSACHWRPHHQEQIIVLLVDKLGFNDLDCLSEPKNSVHSGFDILCQQSVRFTHAYTTHLRPSAAISTVLTGKYAYETGMSLNSGAYLSAQYKSVAENLFYSGWRTAFFSGGPPVLRHLGLQQGFEVFEDNFALRPDRFFRPFEQSVKIYVDWLQEIGGKSLAVFYVPDLNFPDYQTVNDLGENRNLSFESQLEELDENIFQMISYLQKKKLWDKTTFVIAGLSGHSFELNRSSAMDLRSEFTQIALLIKPRQPKPRDESLNWTLDQNVSLVDLAPTILELAGGKIDPKKQNHQGQSLMPFLNVNSASAPKGRLLLSEGALVLSPDEWWRNLAVRLDQFVFIQDVRLKVFNSLIDKQELSPLSLLDPSIQLDLSNVQNMISASGMQIRANNEKLRAIEKLANYSLWSAPQNQTERSNLLAQVSMIDSPTVKEWAALDQIQNGKYQELAKFARLQKNDLWKEFAEYKLKTKNANLQDACLLFALQSEQLKMKKACKNFEFVTWIEQLNNYTKGDRRSAVLAYFQYLLDAATLNTHRALSLQFDIPEKLTKRLILQEMILTLPPYAQFRKELQKEALRLKFE